MTFRGDREAMEAKASALQEQIDKSAADLAATQAKLREATRARRGIWAESVGKVTAVAAAFGGGAALLASLLYGLTQLDCSGPPIGAGVVTDRYHQPAYTEHGVQCHTIGKMTTCVPTTNHHEARWWVRIAHDGEDREVTMGREQWERVTIGQWFCAEEPCGDAVTVETYSHSDEDAVQP
jgi:hypothetical protein